MNYSVRRQLRKVKSTFDDLKTQICSFFAPPPHENIACQDLALVDKHGDK